MTNPISFKEQEEAAEKKLEEALVLLKPMSNTSKEDKIRGKELLREAIALGSMRALSIWHLMADRTSGKR